MATSTMTDFEWCQYAYTKGWANADSLKVWVASGKITPDEYKTITGIDYVA